jgi:N-acetylglucosamine-6-sulfatase
MAVDESVDSGMKYIKDNGLENYTMEIYMLDNGFSWGEHGLIDKRLFYEESVKVSLLFYAPWLFNDGQVIQQIEQNIDMAPTILELAGLNKPDCMPGKSLVQRILRSSASVVNKVG